MMLAYAMARAGGDVSYLTNNAPIFDADFDAYHADYPVTKIVGPSFEAPPDYAADWVVVIPTGSFDDRFYDAALNQAKKWRARVALLSFETPNWYNSQSPFPRSPLPTESWRRVVAGGGLVVTIAEEGIAPARQFYGAARDGRDLRFAAWHPPVNDLVALSPPVLEAATRADQLGRRRVVAFVRTEDQHKGAHDLLALPPDVFDGHILSLVFGRGINEAYVAALRRHFASARDFSIELHSQISDRDKFVLLAQARLLLFTSYFEGYGYPPVEAAWMGVPVVAYDLPVVRETVGDAALYAPPGDTEAFAAAIRQTLASRPAGAQVRTAMRITPDTATAGRKFLQLLASAGSLLPPLSGTVAPRHVIANTALLRNEPVQSLVAAYSDAVQFSELSATAQLGPQGPVLSVSGRVRGGLDSDRLRFVMAGSVFSDQRLQDDKGQGENFRCQGEIETLPDGAATKCTLLLLRSGGMQTNRVTIPVQIDPALLCLRNLRQPASPICTGSAQHEALLLVDLATLAQDSLMAMVFSEISATLAGQNSPSRLVLVRESQDPVPMLPDEEFLPLADTVETMDLAQARGRVAVALQAGQRVILPETLAAACDIAQTTRTLARFRPQGAGQALLVLAAEHTAGPLRHPGQAAAKLLSDPPHPALARRSLAQRAQCRLLILLADAPIDELPVPVLGLLKRLENRLGGGLRVVVPRRLCTNPDTLRLRFGNGGMVEVLDEASLAADLAAAGQSVGLQLTAQADLIGSTLLNSCKLATVMAEAATAEAELLAALVAPVETTGGKIAAQIRALFAPCPPLAAQGAVLPGAALLGPASRAAAPVPVFPALKTGAVISFTVPSLGHDSALLSGWNLVDTQGAALEQAVAVISFDWQGALPETELEMELLMSTRPPAKPGATAPADPQIMLNLNGVELGLLTLSGKGVKRYGLIVPPWAWTSCGAQVLVLARQDGIKDPKGLAHVSLVSLAVSPLRAPERDWASFAATSQTLAPLCESEPLVFFQKDAKPGFASLGRGWALPETTGIWSNGRSAALVFDPPLQDSTPNVLALVGHSLRPDASGLQRMTVMMGANAVADLMLGGDAATVTELALPVPLTQQGIDHLLLHFPDAVSPAALGLGADSRVLGLHLTGMERIRTTTRTFHYSRTTAGAALPSSLKLLPGVLRLAGATPLPATARFHLSGSNVLAATSPRPEGGWECCLRLSPAHLSAPGLLLSLLDGITTLDAGAVIDSLEIWAEAGPADHLAAEVALLLATPGPTPAVEISQAMANPGKPDLRQWLGQDADRLRDRLERVPLALPFATDLGLNAAEPRILAAGWAGPEAVHTWTQDNLAVLQLGGMLAATDYVLHLQSGALVVPAHPAQRIGVVVAGQRIATIADRHGATVSRQLAFTLPQPQKVNVLFEMPDAVSPAEIGLSPDARLLGLRLHHVALDQLRARASDFVESDSASTSTLHVDWEDPDSAPDWALDLHRTGTLAPVLEISASDGAPFGLSLGDSDLVMHPVATGGDAAGDWRALLVVPPEAAHQPGGILPIWLYAADSTGQLDVQSRRPGPAVRMTF